MGGVRGPSTQQAVSGEYMRTEYDGTRIARFILGCVLCFLQKLEKRARGDRHAKALISVSTEGGMISVSTEETCVRIWHYRPMHHCRMLARVGFLQAKRSEALYA